MVIVPPKPGIVKVAVVAVVGDPPVKVTLGYTPGVYPDPDELIVPSID